MTRHSADSVLFEQNMASARKNVTKIRYAFERTSFRVDPVPDLHSALSYGMAAWLNKAGITPDFGNGWHTMRAQFFHAAPQNLRDIANRILSESSKLECPIRPSTDRQSGTLPSNASEEYLARLQALLNQAEEFLGLIPAAEMAPSDAEPLMAGKTGKDGLAAPTPLASPSPDRGGQGDPEADSDLRFQCHGAHWSCLAGEYAERLVKDWLPSTLREGMPLISQADIRSNPPPDEGWRGSHTIGVQWGTGGLRTLAALDRPPGNRVFNLVSAYPFLAEGKQHSVHLDRVRPWPNGLEAWVDITVGDIATLTFFDTEFCRNGYLYKQGMDAEVILAGLAYEWESSETAPLKVASDVTLAIHKRIAPGLVRREPDGSEYVEFDLSRLAGLVPAISHAPDDYEFYCQAKRVREGIFDGAPYWAVQGTVLRPLDGRGEDFDIEIYLTRQALKGGPPPEPGHGYRGFLWLQGYLWMLGNHASPTPTHVGP